MKKILFLQIKGNSLGGIWYVNKALGESFIERGYDVKILGIRNNHPGLDIKDTPIEITTINPNDLWEITHKRDVLNNLGKKEFLKTLKKYFYDQSKLKQDYNKMKKFINEFDPDYIISSHYQTLFGVPKKYLKNTIFVQHSSFDYLLKDKNNIKTLKKYNKMIYKICWLCESTMQRALDFGYKKNTYIYNPNKFKTDLKANVSKNKKISVITRIHPEKRIDLMIEMVNDVFKDIKYKDWVFEIYGTGSFNEKSEKILKNSNQIFYKGITDNPMEVFLGSSISLNTSLFEGFSLSIIESFSCGIPVISFNFGESAYEQIINNYNGYVIENDDIEEFKNKLVYLMNNESKLEEFSKNAKDFSFKFDIDKITDKWENLFEKADEKDVGENYDKS